jgi:hypothetical protein
MDEDGAGKAKGRAKGEAKRQQVARACKRCASSKRKCSGTFPCDRCIRLDLTSTCEEVETRRLGAGGRPEFDNDMSRPGPRRKRGADDDAASESGISVAMSRSRLNDGSAFSLGMMRSAPRSSSSDYDADRNFSLLMRASGEDSHNLTQEEKAAARAEGSAGLRHERLLPQRVTIAPGVVVDLVPPPGVRVEAGSDLAALSPYPAVRLTFLPVSTDGAPSSVTFNPESLVMFGASREAMPRAIAPGRAVSTIAPPAQPPLWLHPDEVAPRARLAAFVRARGGRYYEWPGRYIHTIWHEAPIGSSEARHPEAVSLPATSYGTASGCAPDFVIRRTSSPTATILIPRHTMFCAWERVFLTYHPRPPPLPTGPGGVTPPRQPRSVAQALSVFTCIDPMNHELFLAPAAPVQVPVGRPRGSSAAPAPLQRYSFGSGYLPAPSMPPAGPTADANIGLVSSLAALSGVGVRRLSDVAARRASAASGGHGLSFDVGRGFSFSSMSGIGARGGSGSYASGVGGPPPPARGSYRTGLSFASLDGGGSVVAPASEMLVLPGMAGVIAPAPAGPPFFADGPQESIRVHLPSDGRPSSLSITLPPCVPGTELDEEGVWDADAEVEGGDAHEYTPSRASTYAPLYAPGGQASVGGAYAGASSASPPSHQQAAAAVAGALQYRYPQQQVQQSYPVAAMLRGTSLDDHDHGQYGSGASRSTGVLIAPLAGSTMTSQARVLSSWSEGGGLAGGELGGVELGAGGGYASYAALMSHAGPQGMGVGGMLAPARRPIGSGTYPSGGGGMSSGEGGGDAMEAGLYSMGRGDRTQSAASFGGHPWG